tara:strand:+ start:327 stop:584 length:258 start_codon:yes stop_codon:yes gene_type:complete
MASTDNRKEAIDALIKNFSQCNGKTLNCRDTALQTDKFEQVSNADYIPISNEQKRGENTRHLLKIRSKIDIRIKLAKAMLKRLTN